MPKNAILQLCRRDTLSGGAIINIMGHAIAKSHNQIPVPNQCYRGIKTSRFHEAQEISLRASKNNISRSEQPSPPRSAWVNQKICPPMGALV
jgi:hypothetical protein